MSKTTVIRVPLSLVPTVEDMIDEHRKQKIAETSGIDNKIKEIIRGFTVLVAKTGKGDQVVLDEDTKPFTNYQRMRKWEKESRATLLYEGMAYEVVAQYHGEQIFIRRSDLIKIQKGEVQGVKHAS